MKPVWPLRVCDHKQVGPLRINSHFWQSIEIENAIAEREKPEETGAGDAENDEEGPEEEEEATNVEVPQELLDEIEQNMQRSKGRLDDAVLNKLVERFPAIPERWTLNLKSSDGQAYGRRVLGIDRLLATASQRIR